VKKNKKTDQPLLKMAAIDEEGCLREIHRPTECVGLELTELTEEIERLLIFESFLRIAISNQHQLSSAVYKYKEYLVTQSIEMSEIEQAYCTKRLLKHGYSKARGFLYYIRNDVKSAVYGPHNSIQDIVSIEPVK
jgi:hypothetical protein